MCQHNKFSKSVEKCSHQQEVLIKTTGNGLAPQSYASTSTGPTDLNYHYNSGNLTEFSSNKSCTQLKQNQQDCYAGPAVTNDPQLVYDSSHDLSLRKVDLNDLKSRLAEHSVWG